MPVGGTGGAGCWGKWQIAGCSCGMTFCGCSGVPLTGTFTSSIYGAFAMTWDGVSTFTGTKSFAYPGNGGCGAVTISLTAIIGCTGGHWFLQYKAKAGGAGSCPTICPGTTGVVNTTAGVLASTVSCSPLSVAWNFTGGAPGCGTTFTTNIYNGGTETGTFTP